MNIIKTSITVVQVILTIGKGVVHLGCPGFTSHQQGLKGGQGGLIVIFDFVSRLHHSGNSL